MELITPELRTQLLRNGNESRIRAHFDPMPVVKLFTPDANATWLISEMYPEEPDILFGLCDLGLGQPELGTVLLSELLTVRGRLGLPVERDISFIPDMSLSEFAENARLAGRIIT